MTRNEYEVSVDSLDKEKVVVIVGRFFSFFPPPGRKLVVIDCYLCEFDYCCSRAGRRGAASRHRNLLVRIQVLYPLEKTGWSCRALTV